MIGLRFAAVLTGLGALVSCPQVGAFVVPEPARHEPTSERSALSLLEAAARASRSLAWSGTQRVVSLASGTREVTDLRIEHLPGQGSAVRVIPTLGSTQAADVLDESLLRLLAANYDLRVVASTTCWGRTARVVEARRPGVTGATAVAARFWLDAASGLVLRRQVHAPDGSLLRTSDLRDLRLGSVAPLRTVAATTDLRPRGQRLDAASLAELSARGWPMPTELPGGLTLFDARLLEQDVLQLAYSDGLSTLSLFGQDGELPANTTGVLRRVGNGVVWQSPGDPERIVWSEHGRTWTLVADTAPGVVDAALLSLPHSGAQVTEDGVVPRAWRGMSRVGAWLNPFH